MDTLICNAVVVTVDARFTIFPQGSLGIKNGKIAGVWEDAPPDLTAGEVLDAGGGLVMPGLVNLHTHLPMSLFRGLADDLPLAQWLNQHIFPAEARHIDAHNAKLGARLACAEMLLGGTTTCCDGYFEVEGFADAVEQMGLRAVLGQGVIDFPAPGVPDPSRNVFTARRFVERWMGRSGRVQPSIFCHSPYTCSARTLKRAKRAADQLGVLFQIHVAETRSERQQMEQAHGCSPVRYLDSLGLLNSTTLLVHAVWVDEQDIAIMAKRGVPIAHCPESNMKLGSGVAPVPDFLAAGIPVGLGTDGCASNNDLDLWGEMDTAAKLHKVHRLDPTTLGAETVVRMATIDGARALGLAQSVGSLETGKRADLVVLDLDRPHLVPMYHPASHLVYTAGAADVRHVMVDGRWVVRDRRLLTADPKALVQQVVELADRIAAGGNSAKG